VSIELSQRFDHSRVEGACSITFRGGYKNGLTLASTRPSILKFDPARSSLRGVVRGLAGTFSPSSSTYNMNSCTGVGTLSDGRMGGGGTFETELLASLQTWASRCSACGLS
jgi:hypothetical protein